MVTRWGQDEGHIDSRRVAQTATNELGKEPVLSRAAVHGRASYPTCFSDCPCMSDTVREKTETLKGTASKSARLIWWDKGKGPGEINADEINAKRIPQRYAIIGPGNWSFCCQLFLNAGRNKPQGATMKLPDILIVLRLRMMRVPAARVATYYISLSSMWREDLDLCVPDWKIQQNSWVTTLACDADQVLMFAAINSMINERSIGTMPRVTLFFWGSTKPWCDDCDGFSMVFGPTSCMEWGFACHKRQKQVYVVGLNAYWSSV